MTTEKRTGPELRKALSLIAYRVGEAGLHDEADLLFGIIAEMVRASPTRGRRAKVKHPPLTGQQIMAMRIYAQENPDAHLTYIAHLFNCNPGRVSEALAWKR
jgi:hypothetical protein